MTLDPDYTLDEVAEALGMSERWVRQKVQEGAAHQRYGHKIKFTADQVELLRAQHSTAKAARGRTTGTRRKAS